MNLMATEFAPNLPADQGAGTRLHFHRVAMAAALVALSVSAGGAWALGLGRLNVQSALGEPLRAEIEVTAISAQENASLKARVASPETYRAAGIDYNQVLATAQVTLMRRADGSPYLRLTSDRAVTEPFVDAILDMQWSSGRLVREYTLLFDPPSLMQSASVADTPPEPAITPVIMDPVPVAVAKPAPVAAPATGQLAVADKSDIPAEADLADEDPADDGSEAASTKPSGTPAPAVVAPKPVPPVTRPAVEQVAKPKPAVPASEPADPAARTLKVNSGDALSYLAERALTPGLSLDQMMVSLYRGNPQAFVNNNMNRLKAGVVLKVPDPETTKAITPEQARQVILAQSADFENFRQRLATGVTTNVAPAQQRQATGKVEAEVTDRKQAEAPKPDKLTLSKGGMSAGKAPGVEDRIAQNRAKQDSTTRVAELSRNLDDLQKLKDQVAPKKETPKVVATPAVKPAAPIVTPPAAPVKPPVVASAPVPKMTPSPVSKAEADDLLGSDDDMDVAVDAPASAAATTVANVAAPSAPEPAAEPVLPTVTAQVPAAVPSAAEAGASGDQGGGFFADINPAMLAGAGALVALLAGGGLYLRSRRKNDGAETSFLESRLQPDSFFGASGGQRVDTRDAASPSSMSYSLSQLDAIGDVDPVAEADVYLAYGRDLQAEEILKEALRTTPDRPAIRTKLMEVYAKRRDTKGVEFVAKELMQITQGQGPDWQRAQELGMSVDPGNPLYQSQSPAANAPVLDMDRTLPLSAMPSAPAALPELPASSSDAPDSIGGEIDLDISLPPTPEMLGHAHTDPQKFNPTPEFKQPTSKSDADVSIDFDLPSLDMPASAAPSATPAAQPPAKPFDLSTISLDLDDDQTVIKSAKPAGAPVPEFVASNPVPIDVVNDPMMRKVELAHEFIQIGDVDGAKDLLKEVVADGQEATRAKARELLDRLT